VADFHPGLEKSLLVNGAIAQRVFLQEREEISQFGSGGAVSESRKKQNNFLETQNSLPGEISVFCGEFLYEFA
jgi:hypothetical protein